MEYTPTALCRIPNSEGRIVMYGIGVEEHPTNFTHGPVSNEKFLLEVVPEQLNSVLVRFNADGSDEVIWHWQQNRWISTYVRSSKIEEDGSWFA